MIRLKNVLVVCSLLGCAFSQPATQSEFFEVASVKPHQGPPPAEGGKLSLSGSRLNVDFYALAALVTFAYDVKLYQVPGVSSLDHTYYDIVADAGDGRARTKAEFRPLMQSLLADRFKLRLHRENKELPVYALVAGTKALKLTPIAPVAERDALRDPRGEWHSSADRGRAITRHCMGCTLQQFVDIIRDNDGLDRPVVDRTGLTGTYDIRVTYVPQNRIGGGLDTGPDEADVFSAVKELGLRLESQTSTVELLIIDHFEKPAEN